MKWIEFLDTLTEKGIFEKLSQETHPLRKNKNKAPQTKYPPSDTSTKPH